MKYLTRLRARPRARTLLCCQHIAPLSLVCLYLGFQEDQRKFLERHMKKPDYIEALQHLTSPLDESNQLGKIIPTQSKVSLSVGRPLGACNQLSKIIPTQSKVSLSILGASNQLSKIIPTRSKVSLLVGRPLDAPNQLGKIIPTQSKVCL